MTITVTDTAAERFRAEVAEWGEPGDCVRVSVVGKGDSGFQFGCDFEPARPDDHVIELPGVTVVVDPVSAEHIRGYTLDVVDGGIRFIPPAG